MQQINTKKKVEMKPLLTMLSEEEWFGRMGYIKKRD